MVHRENAKRPRLGERDERVFMGLAGVAFFDAATYARAKNAIAPHIAAGVGALIVAFIALEGAA